MESWAKDQNQSMHTARFGCKTWGLKKKKLEHTPEINMHTWHKHKIKSQKCKLSSHWNRSLFSKAGPFLLWAPYSDSPASFQGKHPVPHTTQWRLAHKRPVEMNHAFVEQGSFGHAAVRSYKQPNRNRRRWREAEGFRESTLTVIPLKSTPEATAVVRGSVS